MQITELPFNHLIGLIQADKGSGFLVFFSNHPQYTNHFGTVHGSALLSMAEAGSGHFLFECLGDFSGFTPVVRKVEAKFRQSAIGQVQARCLVPHDEIAQLKEDARARGRLSASLPMVSSG